MINVLDTLAQVQQPLFAGSYWWKSMGTQTHLSILKHYYPLNKDQIVIFFEPKSSQE